MQQGEGMQRQYNHPLFDDSEFVPNDMKHVLFLNQVQPEQEDNVKIVLPIDDDEIGIQDLEGKINSMLEIIQSPLVSKLSKQMVSPNLMLCQKESSPQTLKSYKKKYGKKLQSVQEFQLVSKKGISLAKEYPLISNNYKYEVCIIMMAKQSDVFTTKFQWSPEIDLQKILLEKINAIYRSNLVKEDVEYCNLNIELCPEKDVVNFRFKRESIKNQHELKEIVFNKSETVYLGVEVMNSKFKLVQPNLSLINNEGGLAVSAMVSKMINNPIKSMINSHFKEEKEPIMVLFFDSGVAMRVNYAGVKNYKIKYLLGIFEVAHPHRKGLMVLGKIYKPDDLVSSFQHAFTFGDDVNFVAAKIVSEGQLFFSEVGQQKEIAKRQELDSLVKYKSTKEFSKLFCLSAFLNQAVCLKKCQPGKQLINKIIHDYISNYYIQFQIYETISWKRFIKTMIKELQTLEVHRGWAFRVVNYLCDKEINSILQFNNFIVASRREEKAKVLLKEAAYRTIFKIKSISGRLAAAVGSFNMDEVLFLPYTSFKIVRKSVIGKVIQYDLQQLVPEKSVNRSSLLVWVDDKPKQGQIVFSQLKGINLFYPVYLFQIASNAQFRSFLSSHQLSVKDPSIRKIIISNMKRRQGNKDDEMAGIATYEIAGSKIDVKSLKFIYYIGYKEGTLTKLRQKKISEEQVYVTNSVEELNNKLIELINWIDIDKSQEIKSSYVLPNPQQNWNNIFMTPNQTIQSQFH